MAWGTEDCTWEGAVCHWTGSSGCWWCCADGDGLRPYVQQFVQSSLLCYRHHRVQLHADHRAGQPDEFVQPGCILLGYAAPSAYHGVENETGNHRFVERPQKFPADVKRPHFPQEVRPALTFSVQMVCVYCLVQVTVVTVQSTYNSLQPQPHCSEMIWASQSQ